MTKQFYRYEAVQYAEHDMDGEYVQSAFPNPKVELREYNLFKETEKGYWIGYGKPGGFNGPQKWVSKTSKKRFAYPTKKEALTNFIKRNERRVRILKYQLDSCETAIFRAKEINPEL